MVQAHNSDGNLWWIGKITPLPLHQSHPEMVERWQVDSNVERWQVDSDIERWQVDSNIEKSHADSEWKKHGLWGWADDSIMMIKMHHLQGDYNTWCCRLFAKNAVTYSAFVALFTVSYHYRIFDATTHQLR
jgi:hypothetical protein